MSHTHQLHTPVVVARGNVRQWRLCVQWKQSLHCIRSPVYLQPEVHWRARAVAGYGEHPEGCVQGVGGAHRADSDDAIAGDERTLEMFTASPLSKACMRWWGKIHSRAPYHSGGTPRFPNVVAGCVPGATCCELPPRSSRPCTRRTSGI